MAFFTNIFDEKNIKIKKVKCVKCVKKYQDTMTTNIIFGIKQLQKKCESIVIQMVINNLWRIKCGKKLKKTSTWSNGE